MLPPRKKAPRQVDPAQARSRARGALLGLSVGDALGTTHEFRSLPAPSFPQLTTGTLTEMRGGGPFQVKPGQVTDDTQMACCIAGVLRSVGRYDADEVLKQYLAWQPIAFDIGNLTRQVLDLARGGVHRERAALEAWIESGRKSAGNGSLMRTAPIGVFFAQDQKARVQASLEDSALTHFDPRCQLACVVLNGAIAAALVSVDPPTPKLLLAGALADLSVGGAQLGRLAKDHVQHVRDALECIRADLAAAQEDDPKLYGPELHLLSHAGFVRVGLRLAFWELFHTQSFEEALVDVVNRGGDSDTNGAITGALLGALYGEEAIPERWRTCVLEVLLAPRGPFADVYHPRKLLELVPSDG
ncbi:MAG: ADP-ribosylglycohydrolase family protein [Myxococcota bacterium]